MSEKALSNLRLIDGIYTDPFHSPTTAGANLYNLPAPWLGGLRFLARRRDDKSEFLCIGCDDGIHFWTLYGKVQDENTGKVVMDFTPKAPGVGLLQCGFDITSHKEGEEGGGGALHFYESEFGISAIGNTWRRLYATSDFAMEPQLKHAAFNDINGLYVDPEIFDQTKKGFAGIRVISDRLGKLIRDEICVIGTDDGKEWWCTSGGSFTDKAKGEFQMNGDDSSIAAKCKGGTVEINNGETKWIKMAPKMDLHALPKHNP